MNHLKTTNAKVRQQVLKGNLIRQLVIARNYFRNLWLKTVSKSFLLTKLHYVFLSDAFTRETIRVLNGHITHNSEMKDLETPNYFLRRATHRIEKGLTMNPRRGVFAEDYILETTQAYERAVALGVMNAELRWTHDVLDLYFSTVERTTITSKAEGIFRRASRGPLSGRQPQTRVDQNETNISSADMLALAKHRKSIRWFRSANVPHALIDEALEVALQAPSACNRQAFRFMIFDDRASVERVARLAPGSAGFDTNIPMIVVIVGRLRAYPEPRDRHVIFIDSSLAAMSFILALETQSVSSCIINWPDLAKTDREARRILDLSDDEQIIMLIAVGYALPNQLIPYSQKQEKNLIAQYNPCLK